MQFETVGETQALVDVHAHFVTDSYVAAATAAGHARPNGMPGWPHWSVREHLDLMDRSGIGKAMLSVVTPGTHFGDDQAARRLSREVNEFGAGQCRAHPDRFGYFASLPLPDVQGALAEAVYALDELGVDGFVVLTNAHGHYLGDPLFEPLWAELDRRRTIVFVHPTSPPHSDAVTLGLPRPVMEFIFDSARAAANLVFSGVADRYPGISWIFTHGGGALPLLAARMDQSRALIGELGGPSDVPVRQQLSQFWYDIAGTPFPDQAPALLRAFGSERILYGSDYCWTPPHGVQPQIESIDSADPPCGGETWRELTTRNASRLLRRGDGAWQEPWNHAGVLSEGC